MSGESERKTFSILQTAGPVLLLCVSMLGGLGRATARRRRGRRVAVTATIIGCAVVIVPMAYYWGSVKDHATVLYYIVMHETTLLTPDGSTCESLASTHLLDGVYWIGELAKMLENAGASKARATEHLSRGGEYLCHVSDIMQMTANISGIPVRCDSKLLQMEVLIRPPSKDATLSMFLRDHGFSIMEQRFPRHAYIVIDYTPIEVEENWIFPPEFR